METFWVLTYIVVTWHHQGDVIEKLLEPRAQWMQTEEICRLTATELELITPERVLFGTRCQLLKIPTN